MTQQQYNSRLQELKDEYVKANAKFKAGDKIKITIAHTSRIEYAYVNRVRIGRNGDIRYDLVKVKSDGTPSLQGYHLFPYDKVELEVV